MDSLDLNEIKIVDDPYQLDPPRLLQKLVNKKIDIHLLTDNLELVRFQVDPTDLLTVQTLPLLEIVDSDSLSADHTWSHVEGVLANLGERKSAKLSFEIEMFETGDFLVK